MRIGVLLIAMVATSVGVMSAQEVAPVEIPQENLVEVPQQQAELDTIKGIHPFMDQDLYSNEWRHWSMFFDAGVTWFDGDLAGRIKLKHPFYGPGVNVGVMYSFNSTWSLGMQYGFSKYGAMGDITGLNEKGETQTYTNEIILDANLHKVSGFVNIDIFNAFRPQNKHKLFDLSIILGGGSAWYFRNRYFASNEHPQFSKDYKLNQLTYGKANNEKYKNTGFFLGGLDFQFNVSRPISVGLKLNYSFYFEDGLDGRYQSINNDGIVDISLSVRYKIDAIKHSHELNAIRHFNLDDKRYRQLETPGDGAGAGLAPCADTVFVPHTDTVVMQYPLPLPIVSAAPVLAVESYHYVYFDNDKYNLDDEALYAIQQAADAVYRSGDSVHVAVVGYCDNTGSVAHNDILAQNRANRVADELIQEYAIVPDHVGTFGYGILKGRRSKAAYSPNRRVDIRILNKQEWDEYLAEIQNKKSSVVSAEGVQTPAAVEPVAASQSQDQAPVESVVPTVTTDERHVIMPQNMNLSVLARREYGNMLCWVYIYQANKDKIANPDYVQAGVDLILPNLSEADKAINRQQANAILAQINGEQSQVAQQAPVLDTNLSGEIVARETTRADWTLSKMARKHYGNAYCWVYIYQANMSKIANPNKITEGLELNIPALTANQQAITKEQAQQIFESLK